MEEKMLIDVWRTHNKDFKNIPGFGAGQILPWVDYFLLSQSLMGQVEEKSILPGYKIEHSLILLDLKLEEVVRGKVFGN